MQPGHDQAKILKQQLASCQISKNSLEQINKQLKEAIYHVPVGVLISKF